MVTTVHTEQHRALRHLWTWLQAAGLVYAIGFGMVLLGAAVVLPILGAIELVSWIAGLMR
jgi:hypothetical protein